MAAPRRRRVTGLLVVGGALLALWLAPGLFPRMQAGSGVVLDTTTGQPVPGAEVTLDCQRGTGFHTTETVRQILKRTDAAGGYRFDRRDLRGCDFGFVRAGKAGYVEAARLATRYAYSAFDRIPPALHLTPAEDAGMVRLASLDSGPRGHVYPAGRLPTAAEVDAPPNESAVHEYDRLFSAFYPSKWIARTATETAFVVERYCGRMEQLYAMMSEADRASVLTRIESYEAVDSAQRTLHLAPRDHATEVLPYCRSRGTIRSPYVYRFGPTTSCVVVLQNPTRVRNLNCRERAVQLVLAFGHGGAAVESAHLAPGEEYAARNQGVPRIAECPSGWTAVTAAGQPWAGVANTALCRAPAEAAAGH